MSAKNQIIEETQDVLGDLADGLRALKAITKDPSKVTAINHELIEINHRITIAGGLIFHRQTAAITRAAMKVQAAKMKADAAVEHFARLRDFIKAISSFLSVVDKVLDAAKLSPPA